MGFWNKLGKIALQAAPYVAAPFTAGTSLMATGATQKLGQKWAEHDAKKAIAKGLAPSKFDKILGGISMGAGLASSMGMGGAITGLSKAGAAANAARAAGTAQKLTGFQNALSKVGQGAGIAMGVAPRGAGTNLVEGGEGNIGGGLNGWQGKLAGLGGLAMSQFGGDGQVQDQGGLPQVGSNQALPRSNNYAGSSMAQALAAGKNDALRNQPWRAGYDIVSPPLKEGDPDVRTPMPPIYPQYEAPQPSSFQQNLDQATATPRMARKRNPEMVTE